MATKEEELEFDLREKLAIVRFYIERLDGHARNFFPASKEQAIEMVEVAERLMDRTHKVHDAMLRRYGFAPSSKRVDQGISE